MIGPLTGHLTRSQRLSDVRTFFHDENDLVGLQYVIFEPPILIMNSGKTFFYSHFTPTIWAIFPRDKMALDVSQTTPWNFVVQGHPSHPWVTPKPPQSIIWSPLVYPLVTFRSPQVRSSSGHPWVNPTYGQVSVRKGGSQIGPKLPARFGSQWLHLSQKRIPL